jgi:hypothetical protein
MKYLLAALALIGSPVQAQAASDGYAYKGPSEPIRTVFTVQVKEYNSRDDLLAAARAAGVKHGNIHAFATIQGEVCTMHIMRPARRYQPEHIGHEFVHCMYGKWH